MQFATKQTHFWWQRPDLGYKEGRLFLGRQDLTTLARSAGTPVFVYSAARVKENLERMGQALAQQQLDFKIFYALKANRYLPLVTYLKLLGQCGLDVCSPGEMRLARQVGFQEAEITYTGTSLSDDDLDWLQRHPGVHINCDSISSIKRLGERCRGRTIGLRINPQMGAGYHPHLKYAGETPTKFGIYQNRFEEAVQMANHYRLRLKTLHFHCGSGYLSPALDTFAAILERTHWFLDRCPEIDTLDIGGGLGVPLAAGDEPLDVARWAEIVGRHAKTRHLTIHVEPGDYLVKDAGVLLVQVNTVEEKGGTNFVGVNAGFNLQNLAVYYNIPFEVVPLNLSPGSAKKLYTVAGNINEAIDIFAADVRLPPVAEGALLALLNVGGYGSASSSNHCMRGSFSEYLLLH